jgi:hypothetical protein
MKNSNGASKMDIKKFYSEYPQKIISRPGYPARAAYRSWLLWNLYGKIIRNRFGEIKQYADIGGCFGFGANALSYHISRDQTNPPKTHVFEISNDYIKIGKQLFPMIEFHSEAFEHWKGEPQTFDLVSLFDVVEHLPDPKPILKAVASKSKLVLLDTPLETSGEWMGSHPPKKQGENHPDGHVQFFTQTSYERLLSECGLKIIKSKTTSGIVPFGARDALMPEKNYKYPRWVYYIYSKIPHYLLKKIKNGGYHLALCKSELI